MPETPEPQLLPCPFCGCSASFTPVREHDDSRYFVLSASCDSCDAQQSASIGWRAARGTTEAEREEALRKTAALSWNCRYKPEVMIVVNGEDWAAVYLDDKKVEEGHEIYWEDVLKLLGHSVTRREVDPDSGMDGFPAEL